MRSIVFFSHLWIPAGNSLMPRAHHTPVSIAETFKLEYSDGATTNVPALQRALARQLEPSAA
jgi:hypothetical protein